MGLWFAPKSPPLGSVFACLLILTQEGLAAEEQAERYLSRDLLPAGLSGVEDNETLVSHLCPLLRVHCLFAVSALGGSGCCE